MRAGRREEKEEVVVVGRRGCSAANRSGILSGWTSTLHGFIVAGKGHSGGRTQWGVSAGGKESQRRSYTALERNEKG